MNHISIETESYSFIINCLKKLIWHQVFNIFRFGNGQQASELINYKKFSNVESQNSGTTINTVVLIFLGTCAGGKE
jgi:adenine specific DNA methylase Mod